MEEYEPFLTLFYQKDLIIDIISAIIMLFILITIINFYFINKPKRYIYLISSFTFIFLAFLFKILSHLRIYYFSTATKTIGAITLTYQTLNTSEALVFLGLMAYHIVFILGLYILYAAYLHKQTTLNTILIVYLLLMVGYFSNITYYIFYVTSMILLSIIAFSFYQIYQKNKMENTKLLYISFMILAFSQFIFMFLNRSPIYYAIAEIVQLCGYLFLYFTFLKVLRDGKKKR